VLPGRSAAARWGRRKRRGQGVAAGVVAPKGRLNFLSVGGLITSSLVNLFMVPLLYERSQASKATTRRFSRLRRGSCMRLDSNEAGALGTGLAVPLAAIGYSTHLRGRNQQNRVRLVDSRAWQQRAIGPTLS